LSRWHTITITGLNFWKLNGKSVFEDVGFGVETENLEGAVVLKAVKRE